MADALEALLAKQEITEQLYTYCRAFDRLDDELVRRHLHGHLHEPRVLDLVQALPTAIVCLDAAARIVLINAAACRLLGVVDEQVLGTPVGPWLPQIDALPGAQPTATPDVHHGQLQRQVDGRPHTIEVSLSRLGEGIDQLTTLVLREVTGPDAGADPRPESLS